MELLEVLLWIVGILVVLGVILAVVTFWGLRKLWRFIDDAFRDDGRAGPGRPPLSRARRDRVEPSVHRDAA